MIKLYGINKGKKLINVHVIRSIRLMPKSGRRFLKLSTVIELDIIIKIRSSRSMEIEIHFLELLLVFCTNSETF
jgi:hypothetical protein